MVNTFIPSEIPLEERTVGQILAKRAREYGDKPFVETIGGDTVGYREMHQHSNRLAHGLAAFGVDFQELVLVMLPDTVDFLTVWCGLGKRGAVEVPINLAYRKSILRRLCNDSTAKKIIIDRDYVERLEEVEEDLEHLDCVILYSEDPARRNDTTLPPKIAKRCRVARFEELFSNDASDFEPAPRFHDLMGIMYTSGTTGASKGVATTHSHSFCYADGAGRSFICAPRIGSTPADCRCFISVASGPPVTRR